MPRNQIQFQKGMSLGTFQRHYGTEELEACFPNSPRLDRVTASIKAKLLQLKKQKLNSISDLLGLEGGTAAPYFSLWKDLEIKWKGIKHQPIPDDWLAYTSRSTLAGGINIENRHASHPVNAMLNYAYAALYRFVLIDTIAHGYDPNIGVIYQKSHRSKRHDYVLDLMEPLRPVVDRAILQLVHTETFAANDFQLQADGVCRLNPQLARRVVQVVSAELGKPQVQTKAKAKA